MPLEVIDTYRLSRVSGAENGEPVLCSQPNQAAEMVRQGRTDVNPRSLAAGVDMHCKGVESLSPEQLRDHNVTPELVQKMRTLRLLVL